MNYEELRKQASPALKEVARMGVWDGVHMDVHEGEPIVYAVLRKPALVKFFMKLGVMQVPSLPERVCGIRCKVLLHSLVTKAR